MSLPDEYSIFCTKCDCYNVSDIVCGDCVEEIKRKAHQAGIDEAMEVIKSKRKKKNSIKHFSGMGYYNQQGYNQALDDTIKALQDNK